MKRDGATSSSFPFLPYAVRGGNNIIQFIKKNFVSLLLVLGMVGGLLIVLYPTISDIWNSYHQSRAIALYDAEVANTREDKTQELLQEAEKYNATLPTGVVPHLSLSSSEEKEYNQLLNVIETGIMAYVEIPKIGEKMPIYHGTDEAVLQIAIGHIPGTSLPVGGQGTHAVISGHRGLPSAKLFTNIDKLIKGDTFKIHILGKILTYEVDQIVTVEPDEIDELEIDPNQDYVTLVTCTPYGVNTHRLLVRGHRIENQEQGAAQTSESSGISVSILLLAGAGLAGLLVLGTCFVLLSKRKGKRAARR